MRSFKVLVNPKYELQEVITMRQDDRKIMLESLYDINQIELSPNLNIATVPISGVEKQNLFKDSMEKQVERTLITYERNNPDVIPFRMLISNFWLVDITKDSIKFVKLLKGSIARQMHAYDDIAITYQYKNIKIGLAVHDHTNSKSLGTYSWYFIPVGDIARKRAIYYTSYAYYSEYGVSEYLLNLISKL